MRKLAILITTAFLLSTAGAHEFNMSMVEEENLDHLQEEVNRYSDIPDFASSLIGQQVANVHIESPEAEKTVGIEIKGAEVQELKMGSYEDPTVEIHLEKQDINDITTSDKPVNKLEQKVNNGEIEYTAYGFVNKIKFSVVESFLL